MSVEERFAEARDLARRATSATTPGSLDWAERVLGYRLLGSPSSVIQEFQGYHAPFIFTAELLDLYGICGEGRRGDSGGTHDMFVEPVVMSIAAAKRSEEMTRTIGELKMPNALVTFASAGNADYMAQTYRGSRTCSPVWVFGIEDRVAAKLTDSISEFLSACNRVTAAWKLEGDQIDIYEVIDQPAPNQWVRMDDQNEWPNDWL